MNISKSDIAALQAVRSVIADAFQHPGRDAAVQAIDRLVAQDAAPPVIQIHNHYDQSVSQSLHAEVARRCADVVDSIFA